MEKVKAWIKASRLPAQAFIFPSLLLGQAIHFQMSGEFNFLMAILIHLYGLFMHFYIVYANDYADFETDQLNQTFTPFTGGSRVLLDGDLKRDELKKGATLMVILVLLSSTLMATITRNFSIIFLAFCGLFLLYAYSFKPIKMSYRGYGEILQMIGVGIVLPIIGYVAQGGDMNLFTWSIIFILCLGQLAMAISTSLPDFPSDQVSNKNSTVVKFGISKSSTFIPMLFFTALILLWFNQSNQSSGWLLYGLLFGLITALVYVRVAKKPTPGTHAMLVFVFLAILTNTIFVLGLAISLFL
jgi:1,4-dihydroxy-2-naphthoate polyprenyltransferase